MRYCARVPHIWTKSILNKYIYIFFFVYVKKFHDFIELAGEAISDFTKEVDGKTVPLWSREEIDEIIMAQVYYVFDD